MYMYKKKYLNKLWKVRNKPQKITKNWKQWRTFTQIYPTGVARVLTVDS